MVPAEVQELVSPDTIPERDQEGPDGARVSFRLTAGYLGLDTSFCYQHDGRITSQTPECLTLSMHNSDNTPFTGHISLTTGMLLDMELQGSKQVTLKSQIWDAAEPVYAESQGSNQLLGNGHSLQDHGATPKIEEYNEYGTIVMRARFGYDNTIQTYRVYRYLWVGRPSTRPNVVACPLEQRGRRLCT